MRIIPAPLSIPLLLLALASCSTAPPEPAPAPQPTKPVAAAPPVLTQPKGEWIDWPITPGSWVYRSDNRGSLALFGETGRDAVFIIRCDKSRRQLFLSRSGSVGKGAKMVLRTSAGLQSYPASNSGGTPHYAAISVASGDIMMDRIAYSRGRFAVETTGLQSLAIPVWPEFSRVVEDCRA
ncbi:hypothetical protein [uncultured Parasphingorhabdus sp.]|uniref:hypothetical protein n=1 Tax=uncultured Parasphingorhabdus sp. TaxID=2709694 RepID=UPI0030D777E5|tara:strand:- start:12936 stop:13475 length:540 start_codon:yes stop_codon:yes gene_type:complete